jgi:site-specific DNA-cytosine methylase
LQKLQAVDLYCGCGGMSFIDQKTNKVQIKTQWAVDSVEAMCQSFQVNYPDATVSHGHG